MKKDPSWLRHVAERTRNEPWTLGRLLSRYCTLESSTEGEIATELGCTPDTLSWIFLCRTPSQKGFRDDVESIAQRFGLEPSRLAALVRRADAVVALAAPYHNAGDGELLLAARDREDEEDSL